MSAENQDIVQRAIEEVWNRGNLAAIPDLFAPEFVTFEPSSQAVRGYEAFRQHVSRYRATFPNLHFAIEDSEVERDEVSVRWTATGVNAGGSAVSAANGNGSDVSGITIYRLASGRIVETWVHWDTAGMLQNVAEASGTP
jgi:steroid delta-isomerase-like uncharacterized protein